MLNHQTPSEDEIRIPGFTKVLKQFFQFFFWVWAYLGMVFSRNKFLVLAGLAIGLLLGYLYFISRPTYYRASMVVQYNELYRKTYAEILLQLNNLATTGSAKRLANELSTS